MTEKFIGSKKDVLPAIAHLETIREDFRAELAQNCYSPNKRASIILETRAIKRRQLEIVSQLWFDQTSDDSKYMP